MHVQSAFCASALPPLGGLRPWHLGQRRAPISAKIRVRFCLSRTCVVCALTCDRTRRSAILCTLNPMWVEVMHMILKAVGSTEAILSGNVLRFSSLRRSSSDCLARFCVCFLSARSNFNEKQSAPLAKPCLGGTTGVACAPAWARPVKFYLFMRFGSSFESKPQ